MYKLIAITDRKLCDTDYIERVREIADNGIEVILREKNVHRLDYGALLDRIGTHNIIPHSFYEEAQKRGCARIHMPLFVFERHPDLAETMQVSVSVHSLAQLQRAVELGACAVVAGHVFDTNCKAGLPGRGLDFIREISAASPVPVYGIGGITPDNAQSVIDAGADGVCVMSGFMECADVKEFISRFNHLK